MRVIDFCKKYGISKARLEFILSMLLTSDIHLSKEQEEIYLRTFNSNRKDHKKMLALKKSKVMKKNSAKPKPWNKDDLKKLPWIYKK